MKEIDVMSICNALVDVVLDASEQDLVDLNLSKGKMHLVDAAQQEKVLAHVAGHHKTIELGGSSMNAIRALAALGRRTAFAGAVSNDEFGGMIRERLQALKIESYLQTLSDSPTGSCAILVSPDGERTMNTFLGASRLYDEKVLPLERLTSAKIFHFCGYQWDTDSQKKTLYKALKMCKEHRCTTSFDLADPFVVANYRKDFCELIDEHIDIVFANREEAELLYGLDVEKTAERIAETGAIAVIKLGAQGALIRDGQKIYRVSAVPTRVVDTTGAGDFFAAGFLYGFSGKRSLPVCGSIAALLASDVISRYGVTLSQKTIDAVHALPIL